MASVAGSATPAVSTIKSKTEGKAPTASSGSKVKLAELTAAVILIKTHRVHILLLTEA